jgi:hypothetical protein
MTFTQAQISDTIEALTTIAETNRTKGWHYAGNLCVQAADIIKELNDEVDEEIDDYNKLVGEYNELVDDYIELLEKL